MNLMYNKKERNRKKTRQRCNQGFLFLDSSSLKLLSIYLHLHWRIQNTNNPPCFFTPQFPPSLFHSLHFSPTVSVTVPIIEANPPNPSQSPNTKNHSTPIKCRVLPRAA
ncbi:hypothetical protein VNO80_19151 [Phaseolus coccineus]|uniref:Uncharacterized protein n=1 Tax=Phaseolus coccineus TaxID=3886 RepID=A0AAN9MF36_PHACN